VLILQQLQVAGDPVDVHGSRWTHGQHSLGVRLDLGATGVAYEARVQLLALGCLLNGHQLRLALNPHSDFGASAVLPRPQQPGRSDHRPLVGAHCSVATLGGNLTLAHLKVVAHHQDHLEVLVETTVALNGTSVNQSVY